jgi:hypothetical protein
MHWIIYLVHPVILSNRPPDASPSAQYDKRKSVSLSSLALQLSLSKMKLAVGARHQVQACVLRFGSCRQNRSICKHSRLLPAGRPKALNAPCRGRLRRHAAKPVPSAAEGLAATRINARQPAALPRSGGFIALGTTAQAAAAKEMLGDASKAINPIYNYDMHPRCPLEPESC